MRWKAGRRILPQHLAFVIIFTITMSNTTALNNNMPPPIGGVSTGVESLSLLEPLLSKDEEKKDDENVVANEDEQSRPCSSIEAQQQPRTFLNDMPLPAFVLEGIQLFVIVTTLLCHYGLLGLVSLSFSPLLEMLALAMKNSIKINSNGQNCDSNGSTHDGEGSRETLGFVLLFYGIALPLIAYVWVFLTALVIVFLKRTVLFPFGVRAACYTVHCHDPPSESKGTLPIPPGKVRYEMRVSSFAYLRWWILDHLVRVTSPFIFGAVLTRTRIATIWYWALGMDVNPFKTHVASPVGVGVGGAECEFWKLRGRGTALDMRAYGIYAIPMVGESTEDGGDALITPTDGSGSPRPRTSQHKQKSPVKVLYFVERAERRDDIKDEMPNGPVNLLVAWIALLPFTITIGLAPYAVGFPLAGYLGIGFHSFPTYFSMLIFFSIVAPVITSILRVVARMVCLKELSNLIVECIDIIPLVFAGSSIRTACLKLQGIKVVGQRSKCIFSGWRIFSVGITPKNPHLVSIGEESFLSNAVVVGPVELGRRSFLGLRARVRPGTSIDEGGGVGAQSITPSNCQIKNDCVLVRDWKGEQRTRRSDCHDIQACTTTAPISNDDSNDVGTGKTKHIEHRILSLNARGITASSLHGKTFLRTDSIYVFHRIVQLVVIFASMSSNFVLWHCVFKTPFFLEYIQWKGAQILGLLFFMLSFCLVILPILMVGTKWVTVGNFRNSFEIEPDKATSKYFRLEDKTARRFFSFVSAPIWTAFRMLWQPRFYGTRTQNLVYRALGATIGSDVHIFSNGVEDYDTLTLDDASTVCHGCFVLGHIWEGQGITFGYTIVSRGATILSDRQVWPGARVGAYEMVEGGGKPLRGRTHQAGNTQYTSLKEAVQNVIV